MITKDVDSLTNSCMMEIEKVFRKNGIAAVTHRHYMGNRKLLRGMIEMMLVDAAMDEKESEKESS